MNDFLVTMLFGTSALIAVSSLDDAFIDLLAAGISRRPGPSGSASDSGKLPTVAVFVANWQEENVLAQMVEGNLARIPMPEVMLTLGVYPNDTGTVRVAQMLAERYPQRVRVIVNSMNGPTSKGQMLNEMFRQVFTRDDSPDLVVLHDSEDVIDPRTFAVYAAYAAQYDYIQVPVFSFDREKGAHVASVYMDEFSERHTREMIVRDAVGAAIPSAGVGTCMSKALVRHFIRKRGEVLMSGTVTEDYILGVEAKREGFKCTFAALSADADQGLDFAATREFFPKSVAASIKQKTRWVFGTNFEAMRKLGWRGDLWDVYFFIRDRKGIVTNFLPPMSLVLFVLLVGGYIDVDTLQPELVPGFGLSLWINLLAVLLRYWMRVLSCRTVYGRYDWIGIAVRWPVALYINMAAVFRAWKLFLGPSHFATEPITWSKTVHELPENFAAR